MSTRAVIAGIALCAATPARAATPATPQEVADFWETVFAGAPPNGVPALNPTRGNSRVVGASTVWDVGFDSYRDPLNDQPVRINGVFALPNSVPAPGPSGTYPGIVVTHSVGVSSPQPDNLEDMATFFSDRGYAALAFFMRGWGTSQSSRPRVSNNDLFTVGIVDDPDMPFDNDFTGMAMDNYQAGELLAAQPEVWDPNALSFVGHSGGGYAALMAGIFSTRFSVIACSAPANAAPDPNAWLNFWQPAGVMSWINSQTDPVEAQSQIVRTLSFNGAFNALDNPALVAKNASWRLDGTAIFLYGGEQDNSVPSDDVRAIFDRVNPSDPTLGTFHRSPTGGHGGPESWNRSQAWLAGHYAGITTTGPTALLGDSANGTTVTFTTTGSGVWPYDWSYDAGSLGTDPEDIVSWEYDFGDGTTLSWGGAVDYTYAAGGTYDVTVTITDGAGLRDTAQTQVAVGGMAAVQIVTTAGDPVVVPEGTSVMFTVNLSAPPGGVYMLDLQRDSGDADLTISPATLGFSDANWSNPHDVTLSAADDPDGSSDPAVFSVGTTGIPTLLINAREEDDDAVFALAVGNTAGAPGDTVAVLLSLTNDGGSWITAINATVTYDAAALGNAAAVAGPGLPGAAWWDFNADTTTPGAVTIDASEFVAPAEPAIAGDVATVSFTIDPGASLGDYTLAITSAAVNGVSATVTAGTLTVASCPDADFDGFDDVACGGSDCDDSLNTTSPAATEQCNGVDDNCDTAIDEDWPSLGSACSVGLGVCRTNGVRVCDPSGTGVACDAVAGAATTETCDGVLDEDCDGTVDNGCPCTTAEARPCYGGPGGTENTGECTGGTQTCAGGAWGVCAGQTLPADEVCDDGLDNDCNGVSDAADTVSCSVAAGSDPDGTQPGGAPGGCSCGAYDALTPGTLWLVFALPMVAHRRRRRDLRHE